MTRQLKCQTTGQAGHIAEGSEMRLGSGTGMEEKEEEWAAQEEPATDRLTHRVAHTLKHTRSSTSCMHKSREFFTLAALIVWQK